MYLRTYVRQTAMWYNYSTLVYISIEVTAILQCIWAQPVSAGIDTSTHACVHHTAKMSIMVSTDYNMMHSLVTAIYGPVCQYYRTNCPPIIDTCRI